MIVGGHGRSGAGNRGRRGRVGLLQPRDRAAGDGRQGGAPRGAPAPGAASGACVRRGRWMLGTGLSILGWPLQVIALLLAPLVVVQPALAAGSARAGVLRAADARRARRPPRAHRDGAIVIGVIGAGLCAPPRSTGHTSERLTIAARAARPRRWRACCPTCCARSRRSPASVTMIGAGSGVRLERHRDQARLRRPLHGILAVAAAWGLATAAASPWACSARRARCSRARRSRWRRSCS